MRSYYDHIKSKSIYYQIFIYGMLFLILLKFVMDVWGYDYILKYKSNNFKNISEGCAYYSGESRSKYSKGYYLNINNYLYDTQLLLPRKFPSGLTWRDFYINIDKDHYSCHKIKYVEIDIFITKKILIYDYLV